MKTLYQISITDDKGLFHTLGVVASTMAAAITAAQANLGTKNEPQSVGKSGTVDLEAS